MEWWVWITRGFLFCSDIQSYIEYIVKNHETLSTISPIHVCINRVNNSLVFKLKDGNKLELQSLEERSYLEEHKKIIDKTKSREKVLGLEVLEVVLVQCSLVDD